MHTATTQADRGPPEQHLEQRELVVGSPPAAPVVTRHGGLRVPFAIKDQWTGCPEGPFFDASDFTELVTEAGWPLFFTRKECIDFGLLPMSQEEAS